MVDCTLIRQRRWVFDSNGDTSMSSAETSLTYENKVWECTLLPYRIIVCKDHIQYIVQLQEHTMCRNLSFHLNWGSIAKRYPQLAMAGLAEQSPEMLEDEVRRRVMRLNKKPADRAVDPLTLPTPIKQLNPLHQQV